MNRRVAVAAALLLCGCLSHYPGLSGVVLEAETGSPVKGARVAPALRPDVFVLTNDKGEFVLPENWLRVPACRPVLNMPCDFPPLRTIEIEAESFEPAFINPIPHWESGAPVTVKLPRKAKNAPPSDI
jgi:hypothetical protein